MTLRLSPKNPDTVSHADTKTIEIYQDGEGIKLQWFSPQRVTIESGQWPITKIALGKGALWTNGWSQSTGLAHPELWVSGLINLSFNGILWMNPDAFNHDAKSEGLEFEPGFLGPSFTSFSHQNNPDVLQVDTFRRIEQAFGQLDKKALASLKQDQNEAKKIKAFFEEFVKVRVIDNQAQFSVLLNDKKVVLPAKIIGNRFIHYHVLDTPSNPLVLSIDFITQDVPQKILSLMDYFNQNMEYEITSIKS